MTVAFGRPPLTRRALLAASIGAVYALLLLPAPGTLLGISVYGVAWFLLSVGLLFLTPLAFHAYGAFGLLWIIWRALDLFRPPNDWRTVFDILIPAASIVLLYTSGYLEQARALQPRDEEELDAA